MTTNPEKVLPGDAVTVSPGTTETEQTASSAEEPKEDKIELVHAVPTVWLWVTWVPENLTLGNNVDIGAFTALFAHEGIDIGDDVQIGSHCSVYSKNTIDGTKGKVTIGRGACIGSHTTIFPGVTIGEGAKVGAHSLVTKDIPANSIAYGVPAKVR